jgi:comEA protein
LPDSRPETVKEKRSRSLILTAALIAFAAVFCLGLFIGRLSLRQEAINFTVTADKPAVPVYKSEETEKINTNNIININLATKEELTSLHGIGEVLAERIIAYRNEHGGFRFTYEIMDVEGVGEAKYKAIKDYITVK